MKIKSSIKKVLHSTNDCCSNHWYFGSCCKFLAYQNYTKSATIAAAVSEASSLKLAVSLCAQKRNGIFDCNSGKKEYPNGVNKDQSGVKLLLRCY